MYIYMYIYIDHIAYWCMDILILMHKLYILCIWKLQLRRQNGMQRTQPQLLPTESVPESSTQPKGDETKPRT